MSAAPRSFLLKVKKGVRFPEVPQVNGAAAPVIATDAESWLQSLPEGEREVTAVLLRNSVKKCGKCAKPNAFTLPVCNSCGESILATPVSFSTNVFSSFILGIAKGPFPLTISIRRQTADVLVLDDLLALSPLHLNAIPTRQYVRDWRYLLLRPAEGKALLERLVGECVTAAEEHFLSKPEFCSAHIKGGVLPVEAFMMGFNYPPSQYQLHVQFIAPMLLPFQRYQYLRGTHYTPGRFFPVAYTMKCLDALLAVATKVIPRELVADDAPIEALVDYCKASLGCDYAVMHAEAYEAAGKNFERYANWNEGQFEYRATEQPNGSLTVVRLDSDESVSDCDVSAEVNADKTALQNYGRPYTAEGKPTGSFYSFPKRVAELDIWRSDVPSATGRL